MGAIRGTLRFIHIPNSTDPTQPSYSPADDRYKLLLELTDRYQNVRTLPTDGSMDGIYSIAVAPVDRAGNYMIAPDSLVTAAPRRGAYYGLQQSPTTTIDIVTHYFLYDTAKPKLEVDNFPDGITMGNFEYYQSPQLVALPRNTGASGSTAAAAQVGSDATGPDQAATSQHAATVNDYPSGGTLAGGQFRITGWVTDLSSKQQVYGSGSDNHQGGSGISHVEYSLQLVDSNFNLIPCPAPSVDPRGNVQLTCVNPIIPLRRGKLELPGNFVDPTPTTTNPWIGGSTAWDTLVRPRHRFTIEDTLPAPAQIPTPRPAQSPPNQDFYLFVIRAVDRAGNQTEISRRG
ncbi:MAG: hypothetical protein HY815_24665, partial [Candidatus Riflebacteria bacterium]|nr:hypothetical protein [Candidatus Riflebacteria bacterium]